MSASKRKLKTEPNFKCCYLRVYGQAKHEPTTKKKLNLHFTIGIFFT